jgi:hypothetical protein
MRAAIGASLAVLVAAAACGAATGSAQRPATGLHGLVTRGPLSPVCGTGRPCEGPAPDLRLVFSQDGVDAGSTTTRADGTYRIRLRAGTYSVRVGEPRRTSTKPSTATVPRHGFRRVNFFVDTGIR